MSLFAALAKAVIGNILSPKEPTPMNPKAWESMLHSWALTEREYGLPAGHGLAQWRKFHGLPAVAVTPAAPVATVAAAGGVPSTGVPMSLLGDIGRAVAPQLGGLIGGYFPSIGAAGGTAIGSAFAQHSLAQRANVMPGVGGTNGMMQTMGSLPRILGAGAGMVVGAGILGARTVARSAITYCRRHPAWCAQIGGTGAIAAMIQGGQLPPIKRRRARGISPSEFRGFRRVHKVLSGFCAPRMRVRSRRK